MEAAKKLYQKWVSERSDEEIVLIITDHKTYYKPQIIEIAIKEFGKRNIPECKIQVIKTQAEEGLIMYFPKAEEPLENHLKVLAFLLPGIILVILSERYCIEGYRRKYKELTKFTICGFCFYISFLMLGNLLKVLVI